MTLTLDQQLTLDMLRTFSTRPILEQIILLQNLYIEGKHVWGPKPPIKTMRMPFTAGLLIRRGIESGIRQRLDFDGITYDLQEYKGWLDSKFTLTIEFNTWSDVRTVYMLLYMLNKTFEED